MKILNKSSLSLIIAFALLVPAFAKAAIVPIPVSEGSPEVDSRTKPFIGNGGGITASGLVSTLFNYNITWVLENLGNNTYRYTYAFDNLLNLSALENDFFIETGASTNAADLSNLSVQAGLVDLVLGIDATVSDATINGVNGILFHNNGLLGSSVLIDQISFEVNAAPVWGDFANGSLLNLAGYVRNTGFGTDPTVSTSNYTNWVASVGELITPEPTTLLTLFSALGAAFITSRRKTKEKVETETV